MQTFGDLANFNPHLHVLAADGVFGGDGTFTTLPPVPEALLAKGFRRAVPEFLAKERAIAGALRTKMLWHVVPWPAGGLERRARDGQFPGQVWASGISRLGALWCNEVYFDVMPIAEKTVRQSVSLPAGVARRVKALATTTRTSANRVIVELIESGLEAREREKKRFFEVVDRLADSRNAEDRKRLKEELARMTFGE